MTVHLSIVIFAPLVFGILGAFLPRGAALVCAVFGALVGGTSGAVRAASAAVRGIQTGYLRYYAALLLVGLTGLGAYFLISA